MSYPTDSVDISVTAQLERIADGSPATVLIRVLLHHIVLYNVAQFIRNAQSWNQIYYKSRLIYDAIQEVVEQVGNANETADIMEIWGKFQLYTVAIIRLEKILLNFYYRHRLYDQQQLLPPTDSIELTIIYIETWKDDRKELEETFGEFNTSPYFLKLSDSLQKKLDDNHKIHRISDDLQTLKALVDFFTNLKLTDEDLITSRNKGQVTAVKTSLDMIIKKISHIPTALDTDEVVMQIVLLIYIPFAYLSVQTTSSEWRDHFTSTQIWIALKNLAEHTEDHLQPNGIAKVADLEKERDEFIILLLKLSTADNAKYIVRLLKLAAHIRGPLRARSVELVKMMFIINDYVNKETNKRFLHHYRSDLKKLFKESITTLEGTKAAVTDIKRITLVADEYKKQEANLKALLGKVASLYSLTGLEDQWSAKEDLFNAATVIDEDHLTSLREKLGLNLV